MKRIDIGQFGVTGDTGAPVGEAVKRAIEALAADGGGTLIFPAGHYLSFSIRLLSGVALHLEAGAVLEAADPALHGGQYDLPEDNVHDLYQDFGHSHWHNSLIWAEDAEHIAITGPGIIKGTGLTREGPGSKWRKQSGEFPLSMRDMSAEQMAELVPEISAMQGQGNKAIAFKNCQHVRLEDFTLLNGGHFAVLATGVDDFAIKGLLIDTNRDGLDIDACKRVTITGCRVNTPNDDAIVLKSSYALGQKRDVEDVDIRDCQVSGFDLGTLYDGTHGRTQERAPDQDRVTGRIKIGTESNGDFKRIRVENCTFVRSRGLALETVDGGVIEDVTVKGLSLSEITTAPIFLRIGARLRGPEGTKTGAIRRVHIEDVTAMGILPDYAALIAGLSTHPIEDVTLKDISLTYRGGGSPEWAGRALPELDDAYPEPSMFGPTPAFGLYARHVNNLRLENVRLATDSHDPRPDVVMIGVGDEI